MRTTVLLLTATMALLLMAGGVAQAEVITGTEGPDQLVANGNDSVFGLGGDDLLLDNPTGSGPGGNDSLFGGPGDDGVYAESRDDSASGGPGDDDVSGGLGSDVVSGDDGDDIVDDGPPFDASSDRISGGAGDDKLDAFNSPPVADDVSCGPGNDLAYADETDRVANDCEAIVRGPDPNSDDLSFASPS